MLYHKILSEAWAAESIADLIILIHWCVKVGAKSPLSLCYWGVYLKALTPPVLMAMAFLPSRLPRPDVGVLMSHFISYPNPKPDSV